MYQAIDAILNRVGPEVMRWLEGGNFLFQNLSSILIPLKYHTHFGNTMKIPRAP